MSGFAETYIQTVNESLVSAHLCACPGVGLGDSGNRHATYEVITTLVKATKGHG